MSTRVLLAEDHKIVREGIKRLLEEKPNIEVIAEAEDGRKAVQLMRKMKPDIVIMDISIPNLNGIDATREMATIDPNIKVIALSIHSETHFVRAMLDAGACGYLLKHCAFSELTDAISAVNRGETYLSPNIADILVRDYLGRSRTRGPSVFSVLTPREREVLQLVAEGKLTKEIAKELYVCERTVETHRQHIMSKLGAHSIAEITKYAIREGLTSLEE